MQIQNPQLAEAKLLLSLFPADYTGTFLEIGADYGLDHLYPALELGWKGVYCEPDPSSCAELVKHTECFADRVTVINAAVAKTSGLVDFHLCTNASGTSSLREDWRDINRQTVPDPVIRTIVTNTVSIEQLFDYIGYDLDIISIDTEGSDLMLVENIPWARLQQCKVIMFETGYTGFVPDTTKKVLADNQFNFLHFSSSTGNTFYSRTQANAFNINE